jgi:predicted nucleic acid-binding protein
MKNIIVLDTNVILRYLLKDHIEHFQQAQEVMLNVISGKIIVYVPDSVLAECIYVLLKFYKVPKTKVCEILIAFLSYQGISQINRDILIDSLKLFSAHNIDIVDAIVYATANYQQWQVFSFDQDMKKFVQ